MLWIILANESHQIESCNIHEKQDGTYEVWVTKVGGKGLRLAEGTREQVSVYKQAVDYAIEMNESVLRL